MNHRQSRKGQLGDRSVRNLAALPETASTSRVLNLLDVQKRCGTMPEHAAQPMFRSRVLNGALIVKHRLRTDEQYGFESRLQNSTKIVVPFSRGDLNLGAQSVFVGVRGWTDFVREVSADARDAERDIAILETIKSLPSLDPFLLRESLKLNGYEVADCYFNLSPADVGRMFAFVTTEIQKLIRIATAGGAQEGQSTARLVEALLSTQVDERLDPLRLTMGLAPEAFAEGVFCWKGFLYYKWSLTTGTKDLTGVLAEIDRLSIIGPRDMEAQRYIEQSKIKVKQGIADAQRSVMETLQFYDDAFRELTENGKPAAFRDFLVKSPAMFVSLGEKIGGVSHIASFWRYRFPEGKPLKATVEETVDLFGDFEDSIGV